MGRLTELLFKVPTTDDKLSENLHNPDTPSTTLESTFYNLMDNFEQIDATDTPAVCKLHVPTWLNLWCVIITMCVLAVLVVLGVLVRYVQLQRHRPSRTECYHCFPAASPEFYNHHYLDRSQIMVY